VNLPRSTYYHKPKAEADDRDLVVEIEAIIEELSGYGYRRVTRELHRRGNPVNHKKVHRIMKERGLLKKPKRRWVRTTDSNHGHRIYSNLLQNLAVAGPNQAWAADITYIGILNAFVYLAVILDLFARRAVGYAISRNIATAILDRVLHHSTTINIKGNSYRLKEKVKAGLIREPDIEQS